MAADGSVVIEILGDAKDITAKLKGIAGGAVKTLTAAITTAGTALAGVSAAAIKVGSGFEESMSQVAATMGLSVEEIQNGSEAFTTLQNAAKEAGATTAFSASEAASALNYLALAGYDAATSAEVLPTVLNLAAAGGMDLAYASDLATDAMAALGIEASSANLEQFGDQLAAAASNANASVSQLGEAILVVGGTAKSLAGGTTELNTALGVLANRGIKGAEGGTALRNIILSLSAPTDKAAAALEDLGVAVYDAEGNMRPLNDVFQDLSASMEGMTEGDKTNVLNDIFNKVDLKSAQALLAGTGEEFDALAEAIENSQGAMEDMASVQLDNLSGDITILKSGLEGLGIALYETMQVNARDAVQSITGAVGAISDALSSGGLSAAIEVAGQQIAGFATAIAGQAPKIISAGTSLIQSLLKGIRDNLPALASSAVDVVSSLASGILELAPDILETGLEIITTLALGIADALPELVPVAVEAILQLVETLTDPGTLSSLTDAAIAIIMGLATGLISALPILIEKAPIIVGNMVTALIENAPKMYDAAVELIIKLADGLLTEFVNVAAKVGGWAYDNIVAPIIAKAADFAEAGKQLIQGLWNGINNMAGWIAEKIRGFGEGVLGSLKSFFGIESPSKLMRDEVGKYIGEGVAEGIADSTPDAVKSAEDMASDVSDALKKSVLDGVDISGISAKLKNAVEMESANLSAKLTISSNAPAEARAARDRGNAAQNAAANAAYNSRDEGDAVINIDGKEFYRATLSSLRTVEDENPRTLDDT